MDIISVLTKLKGHYPDMSDEQLIALAKAEVQADAIRTLCGGLDHAAAAIDAIAEAMYRTR